MVNEASRVYRLNVTEETYIETIDDLMTKLGYAVVTDIAKQLNVKSPSVTSMLKKLDSLGFVKYTPYRNVILTQKGLDLAVFLKKRHKSLQEFLELLGVDKTIAEDDACAMEHILHAPSLEKFTVFLEYVKNDSKGISCMENFVNFQKSKI